MAPSCHHHPFLPDPWGVVLQPIIPPPPDKTTGHRPYQSVCGHRPVSLPPLNYILNIFTPLNGPILTRGGFYLTSSWVSSCSLKTPFLPPENCPQFLLSEPLAAAIQGWFELTQKTPVRKGERRHDIYTCSLDLGNSLSKMLYCTFHRH